MPKWFTFNLVNNFSEYAIYQKQFFQIKHFIHEINSSFMRANFDRVSDFYLEMSLYPFDLNVNIYNRILIVFYKTVELKFYSY